MHCYTYTLFWYAAFRKMVLHKYQYKTKNKTYYMNYQKECPYYRPQISTVY